MKWPELSLNQNKKRKANWRYNNGNGKKFSHSEIFKTIEKTQIPKFIGPAQENHLFANCSYPVPNTQFFFYTDSIGLDWIVYNLTFSIAWKS